MKKRYWITILLIVFIFGLFQFYLKPKLPIATGYASKMMCSCHFVANRDSESIEKNELNFFPISLVSNKIIEENQSVSSSFLGMAKQTSFFREGIGCGLAHNSEVPEGIDKPEPAALDLGLMNWPYGEKLGMSKSGDIDINKLSEVLSNDVENGDTKALVVVHNNELIAEKYADGYTADTKLLGWSMTKSITSTLIGILVKDSLIDLNHRPKFEEWQTDDRKEIDLNDLLQMSSGLEWEEAYFNVTDATRMLYLSDDISDLAIQKPLVHPIGDQWYYSSGTSNIISRIIHDQFDNQKDYLSFPYERLFEPIGMHSAVLEADAQGTYVGSSYCFATARDWAKFGLLYLNQGNWNGEQIIDTSWVNYTKTEAPSSDGLYGAHFWLNARGAAYNTLPHDLYSANGFMGQHVFIIPSQNLVVVRLGLSLGMYDAEPLLSGIIEAIDQ